MGKHHTQKVYITQQQAKQQENQHQQQAEQMYIHITITKGQVTYQVLQNHTNFYLEIQQIQVT